MCESAELGVCVFTHLTHMYGWYWGLARPTPNAEDGVDDGTGHASDVPSRGMYFLHMHVLSMLRALHPSQNHKSGRYPPPHLAAWVSKWIPSPSLSEKKPPALGGPKGWGIQGSERRWALPFSEDRLLPLLGPPGDPQPPAAGAACRQVVCADLPTCTKAQRNESPVVVPRP